MKPIWNKFRETIVVVTYVIILALLFYFIVKPLINSVNFKTGEIQEKTLSQEGRAKKLSELPRLREQFNKIQGEKDNIRVLISLDRAVVLIEELEKIAEETGNNITINAEEKVDDKKVKNAGDESVLIKNLPSNNYLKVNILLAGNYGDVVNFIRKIENIQYWSDIISVNISNKKLNLINRTSNSSPFSRSSNDVDDFFRVGNVSTILEVVFYLDK